MDAIIHAGGIPKWADGREIHSLSFDDRRGAHGRCVADGATPSRLLIEVNGMRWIRWINMSAEPAITNRYLG